MNESTKQTQSPQDQRNSELRRILMIPRLVNSSFRLNNRAHEQSVPVDLRKGVELIHTENMMEYAFGSVRQYSSNKPFSVHGDFLNDCAQVKNILEDLFEDLAGDLNLQTIDHVLEEEPFRRITTQNVNESRGLNKEISDKVLPIESNDNGTNKAQKRRISKFTLPPNYDPNNSNWTLRHRYPRPELTELIRYSTIYVNATNLKYCNEHAKNCKSLARLLMMEVFSDDALGVCSFTGARATFYSDTKTDVRPGLDKKARTTLITYVKAYGEKKGWSSNDHKTIINSMRNKLYSTRWKEKRRI